jgi:hypothetical protein
LSEKYLVKRTKQRKSEIESYWNDVLYLEE